MIGTSRDASRVTPLDGVTFLGLDVADDAVRNGDAPAAVAKAVVAAATVARPKLRYTAGPLAGRVSTLRRLVPARAFDDQIRKINRLAG